MAIGNARRISWSPSVARDALADAGALLVEHDHLVEDVRAWTAGARGARRTLGRPADTWLARVAEADTVAVVGVRLDDVERLQVLHGYVLEPAWRSGTAVVVESAERLSALDPARFVEPGFGHAFTLERALHAAHRLHFGDRPAAPRPVAPRAVALDPEQAQAVAAHDGVVQVIAPAGSGKTTVLVERVRELLRRGVPAPRILCLSFNAAAAEELRTRLGAAGLGEVPARTFHSIGMEIARDHGTWRGELRPTSLGQWRLLCARAARDGRWLEPSEAREGISEAKLGLLRTAAELAAAPRALRDGAAVARVYAEYERHQAERGAHDHDDQLFLAVRGLRADAALRGRWQGRFDHVLVDETQDVEPAQELLVRILAAPQDGLFCVGDEDQTLYGWRRASVHRMLELDLAYPGLQRVSLAHNYRCPPAVVEASRRLIEHNAIRFPKEIRAAAGRSPADGDREAIVLREEERQSDGAAAIARVLASRRRGEIVVLARTTNLLRAVALACADLGVAIAAPARVFELRGARRALEAYLRLCGTPGEARPEDVAEVCRAPNRGLPYETEERVAARLRDGATFVEALADLPANERQRRRLDEGGPLLDRLAATRDAAPFVRLLRTPGGLDEHFAEAEALFGGTEQVELETLAQAEEEAAGLTVDEYAALLARRTDALGAIRDDTHGIELTTIHGAKGRQWPHVELFACEERQLPHHHAIEATEAERRAGEGVEAERRLAYVAFTRAQERLVITLTRTVASRFLTDAGLAPSRPYREPEPRRSAAPGRPAGPAASPVAARAREPEGVALARRVGLAYAVRTAGDRAAAVELAATAVERGMVGPATTSEGMTLARLLDAIEGLGEAERGQVLEAARLKSDRILVGRLDAGGRRSLARALRAAAD